MGKISVQKGKYTHDCEAERYAERQTDSGLEVCLTGVATVVGEIGFMFVFELQEILTPQSDLLKLWPEY